MPVTLPVTSSVLAGLVPQFGSAMPANTPMFIRVTPTVGPFISSQPGPNGEPAELVLANLLVEFVQPNTSAGDRVWLTLAVDTSLGFDLAYDAANGVLAPIITPPPAVGRHGASHHQRSQRGRVQHRGDLPLACSRRS